MAPSPRLRRNEPLVGLRRSECTPHCHGLVLDHKHISADRRFRPASPLLPPLNGADLQPVTFRKLLPRETLPLTDLAIDRASTRSGPSLSIAPGNLRQGPQSSVDRRGVRKQVGHFRVDHDNVGTHLKPLDVFPADQRAKIGAFVFGTKFIRYSRFSLPHTASSLPASQGER